MVHLEGPIVDSFYDMSLCSWAKTLEPPLPCLGRTATAAYKEAKQQDQMQMAALRIPLHIDSITPGLPEHMANDPHYDPDITAEIMRSQSVLLPKKGETRMNVITRHLSMGKNYWTDGRISSTNGLQIPQFSPTPKAMLPMLPRGMK